MAELETRVQLKGRYRGGKGRKAKSLYCRKSEGTLGIASFPFCTRKTGTERRGRQEGTIYP